LAETGPLRPYCVGLTGGVGSGKSTAAHLFATLGAGLVDTDAIAHALTAPGGEAMPAIASAFGKQVVAADGRLDRAAMRACVFSDATARKRLETLLHPLIRAEALRLVALSDAPYVLLVVPLLLENFAHYRTIVDRVAVVDCDESTQIARTATRPGVTPDQARAILAAQSDRQARLTIADDVIDNSAGLVELEMQVQRLHRHYLALAKPRS
jgi:dephospho-CoA kinase